MPHHLESRIGVYLLEQKRSNTSTVIYREASSKCTCSEMPRANFLPAYLYRCAAADQPPLRLGRQLSPAPREVRLFCTASPWLFALGMPDLAAPQQGAEGCQGAGLLSPAGDTGEEYEEMLCTGCSQPAETRVGGSHALQSHHRFGRHRQSSSDISWMRNTQSCT